MEVAVQSSHVANGYFYSIVNLADEPVRVSWREPLAYWARTQEVRFGEVARHLEERNISIDRDGNVTLPAGAFAQLIFVSTAEATVTETQLQVSSPGATDVETPGMEALVAVHMPRGFRALEAP